MSPSWPRPGLRTPTAPPSPQDWKEKYIHENYTKALAGKLVEMVRTGHRWGQRCCVYTLHLLGGDEGQRAETTCPRGGGEAPLWAPAALG